MNAPEAFARRRVQRRAAAMEPPLTKKETPMTSTDQTENREQTKVPPGYEMVEGKLLKVVNPDREGWWRYHSHYDRDGYCDNPARGY